MADYRCVGIVPGDILYPETERREHRHLRTRAADAELEEARPHYAVKELLLIRCDHFAYLLALEHGRGLHREPLLQFPFVYCLDLLPCHKCFTKFISRATPLSRGRTSSQPEACLWKRNISRAGVSWTRHG